MQFVMTMNGPARLDGDELALLETPFPDLGAALTAGGAGELRRLAQAGVRGTTKAALQPAIPAPSAIWGVGLNYHSKAATTGRALPTEPILFLAPHSSLGLPDQPVALPLDRTSQPDYEGEIAVVIGSPLYRATPAQASSAVIAVAASNDLTARDVMKSTGSPLLAKGFPGFTQIGAGLRLLEDPAELDGIGLRTLVNGELRQNDRVAGMIFAVPELLSRISYHARLDPGDAVLTGTPSGTGQDLGVYLRPGDSVTVEVDGVLPLVTRFR